MKMISSTHCRPPSLLINLNLKQAEVFSPLVTVPHKLLSPFSPGRPQQPAAMLSPASCPRGISPTAWSLRSMS